MIKDLEKFMDEKFQKGEKTVKFYGGAVKTIAKTGEVYRANIKFYETLHDATNGAEAVKSELERQDSENRYEYVIAIYEIYGDEINTFAKSADVTNA